MNNRFKFARAAFLCSATAGIVLAAAGVGNAQGWSPPATLMPPLAAVASPLANPTTGGAAPGGVVRGPAITPLKDVWLDWPVAAADAKYKAIDGHKIWNDVKALTNMSEAYRDAGHPQYWGRLIGTTADKASETWMAARFKAAGLETRVQTIDLPDQWFADSWSTVVSNSGGQTVNITTAFPAYQTAPTKGEVDLEAVWLSSGSEADYIGRDVKGKAVFIQSMPMPGSWRHEASAEGNIKLAESKGAAAIFIVIALPGNIRTALYPTRTDVPTFSVGMKDGYDVRDMIAKGGTPHMKLRLDAGYKKGLKTSMVWGVLPGTTDESIFVEAHRDGWFTAATDNGGGAAGLVNLAEYFAKIPKAQRKRTMTFVGVAGHHNGGNYSSQYMVSHRDTLWKKTALFINMEHIATAQTYLLGEDIRTSNMGTGMLWYAGGPRRPKLNAIAVDAFKSFGVSTYVAPEVAAPGGEMSGIWPYVPGVQASDYNMFFQADAETADTVPWTALQNIVRAYAKIIDGVNKLPLSDVQRPDEPPGGVAAPLASASK